MSWGPSFPRGKDGPQTPRKDARGREFRLSSRLPARSCDGRPPPAGIAPLGPHSQRPKRGPCGGPSLETPLGCSDDRLFTPTAYFVTPRGFVRLSANVPCSCPRGRMICAPTKVRRSRARRVKGPGQGQSRARSRAARRVVAPHEDRGQGYGRVGTPGPVEGRYRTWRRGQAPALRG